MQKQPKGKINPNVKRSRVEISAHPPRVIHRSWCTDGVRRACGDNGALGLQLSSLISQAGQQGAQKKLKPAY